MSLRATLLRDLNRTLIEMKQLISVINDQFEEIELPLDPPDENVDDEMLYMSEDFMDWMTTNLDKVRVMLAVLAVMNDFDNMLIAFRESQQHDS